ncbi:transporter substrate-binding domain-containing protein [Methylobrevis pamukkalensis]|uniref:Aliphatic amidase expression-regulating protein n=1 Tax=Methylobrevis pamukkalensis TaxID=1439726 RepID=A0A1E3H224_9HYPH|nr:transporter substrate-binding domain-containing protein [Methylobrevis pamukkalensis]ODN70362.1 Aliphatic amidase expression-regulating protein [Methylobrevis pamukkalensis]
MTRQTIPVSIIFSTVGAYAGLGRAALDGALAAVAEVNADERQPFRIEPVVADPGGTAELYGFHAERALSGRSCRHIIGTLTSWSRKEVIPVVERHGGLLWYAFPYEGFETSDHVLYFGACPNQHLLPLLDHVLPRHGSRPFLVGSNYIWGWEINRIARELIEAGGGAVRGERYLPLGAVDVIHLVEEIRQTRPDFVLSNLIGPSARAFVEAYADLGRSDPAFAPSRRPIVSCNMTEIDLEAMGPAAAGHLATAIYFDSLDTAENRQFKERLAARHGMERPVSSCLVSAYSAVKVLAAAVAEAGTDDPQAVRAVVTSRGFETPLGMVRVDPATQHAAVRPHLGRARADGGFDILQSADEAILADPYLVTVPRRASVAGDRPLKVVP